MNFKLLSILLAPKSYRSDTEKGQGIRRMHGSFIPVRNPGAQETANLLKRLQANVIHLHPEAEIIFIILVSKQIFPLYWMEILYLPRLFSWNLERWSKTKTVSISVHKTWRNVRDLCKMVSQPSLHWNYVNFSIK